MHARGATGDVAPDLLMGHILQVRSLNAVAPSGHSHLSPARGRLADALLESSVEGAHLREAEVVGYLSNRLFFEQQALRAFDLQLLNEIGKRDAGQL